VERGLGWQKHWVGAFEKWGYRLEVGDLNFYRLGRKNGKTSVQDVID